MKCIRIIAMLVLLAGSGSAWAEYPNRAVTIVNPFGVGGSGDSIQRVIAQGLTEETGQPFIVENKVGAAGRVGYGEVAQADGDGYTLVAADVSYSAYPSLYQLPWNFDDDLVPVAVYGDVPFVLTTTPDTGLKDLQDLLDYAKEHPGEITFSSSGIGAVNHLVGEVVALKGGVELRHVPYRGGSAALQGLLSGTVKVMITGLPSALERAKAGELVILAQTGAERSSFAPEIPTLKEFGIDASMTLWYGMMAPKGTPEKVIDYLHENVLKVLEKPAVIAELEKFGVKSSGLSPEEMEALISSNVTTWGAAVQAAGIKVD